MVPSYKVWLLREARGFRGFIKDSATIISELATTECGVLGRISLTSNFLL